MQPSGKGIFRQSNNSGYIKRFIFFCSIFISCHDKCFKLKNVILKQQLQNIRHNFPIKPSRKRLFHLYLTKRYFKELIGSTKATHIYKGTQAQTQKQTFVKKCSLQTLQKPFYTIKTIPFDKSACIQHGVWQYGGWTLLASAFYRYQLRFQLT